MSRYIRQQQLPEVGLEGQQSLARAHLLVVGAGGLGCPVLHYLVGAGVGKIRLLDDDVVSQSNLHRQPLYAESQLGAPKVQVACARLQDLNPEVVIEPVVERITPANVAIHCDGVDMVLDCADSFATSYVLSDHCRDASIPLVSASVLGQKGYIGAFCGGSSSLRSVFPELPQSGATCATSGVLGSAVGVVGSLQAHMALQLLLQTEPSPLGRMVTVDLASLTFGGFNFSGADEPEQSWDFIATEHICPEDIVYDLRTSSESPRPVVDWAIRFGVDQFCQTPPTFDSPSRVVIVCRSGVRAWRAANVLRQSAAQQEVVLVAVG